MESNILLSLLLPLSLIITILARPSLSLHHHLQSSAPGPPRTQFQGFQLLKKTAPPFSIGRRNNNERPPPGKFYRNDADSRRFSAMLPKGYVPPSGSSPCHNVYPNSVAFFCDLSTQMQKP